MIDMRFPAFPWADAARRFCQEYGPGVAWSTVARRWYVLTSIEGETDLAWEPNGGFVIDMLPTDVRLRGFSEVGRILHMARMLLSRDGDPQDWARESGGR